MPNKIQIGVSNTLVNKQRDLVHKAKYTLSVNSMKYLSSLICMIHKDDTEFKAYSTTASEMTELIGSKIDTIKLRQISSELLNLKVSTIDNKGRPNGGFSMFDVVRTKWDGEDISIFLDDEGLFKPNNLGVEVKGVDSPLFGTLIITGGTDDEGRTLSIPDGISMHDIHSFISEVKYVTSS